MNSGIEELRNSGIQELGDWGMKGWELVSIPEFAISQWRSDI
jgi:hypothetical protein